MEPHEVTVETPGNPAEPGSLLAERLRLRLAALKEHRERFIADAQRTLAAMDAAIAELAALDDPDAARMQAAATNGERP